MASGGGERRDIIVIGGSAGSMEAIRSIVRSLPADLPAAVFIVIHGPPREPNLFPDLLKKSTALPVELAAEGQPIVPGRIYVPIPDRHLMIANRHLHLTRGPKEGLHRPSINVTFRSAAASYGRRVIAVVLSGMLDDGAAGLWEVGRQGGVTVVQDPAEAPYPSMPMNALRDARVDYRLQAREIGPLLIRLVSGEQAASHAPDSAAPDGPEIFSGFTCPECRGPLWMKQGGPAEFRCRVGHVFSLKTLIDEHTSTQERKLYEAIVSLEEGAALAEFAMERIGEEHRGPLRKEAAQLRQQAQVIRKLLEERATPAVD